MMSYTCMNLSASLPRLRTPLDVHHGAFLGYDPGKDALGLKCIPEGRGEEG